MTDVGSLVMGFSRNSFEQYFQNRTSIEYNSYVKAHYDTTGFFNSFISDNPSTISRLANLMTNALKKRIGESRKMSPLPKLFIVVLR